MNANVFKIIAIMLVLAGCSLSGEKDNVLSYTTVGKGILGGGEGIPKQNVVIQIQEEWVNLITAMGSNATNILSETEIDFNKDQIIAVFDKVYPYGWGVKNTIYFKNIFGLLFYSILSFQQIMFC